MTQEDERTAQIREWVLRMRNESATIRNASTVPIVRGRAEDGVPVELASGVLLMVAGEHFIITAAHVTDEVSTSRASNFDFGMMAGLPGTAGVPLANCKIIRTGKEFDPDDHHDMSIVCLTAEQAAQLKSVFSFLTVYDFCEYSAVDGPYIVFGFPADWAKIEEPREKPVLGVRGFPCVAVSYLNGKEDGGDNFLLSYPEVDGGEIPHPRGMSGGGVWRLTSGKVAPEEWCVEDVKLVGMQQAYHRKGYVRCTRIQTVLQMLYQQFESLRTALAIVTAKYSGVIEMFTRDPQVAALWSKMKR